MWEDIEQGIIRQGDRENFANKEYLKDNNWRRVGLLNVLPVDASMHTFKSCPTTSTIQQVSSRKLEQQKIK